MTKKSVKNITQLQNFTTNMIEQYSRIGTIIPIVPGIYSDIEEKPGIYMRCLNEEDASELYSLIDRNRQHLRTWLPWAEKTRSEPFTSKLFVKKRLIFMFCI